MKNKGFIKLYRNVLSKPEMTDLVAKHGAEGFGVYMMLMIYLSQCDDYEGPFTNGLLSSIAVQAHKSRKYVRHIACDFQLFEINGKRFRAASGFGQDSIRNESKTQNSPARTNRYADEDIEIDIEKENKEKAGCVCPDDTRLPKENHSTPDPSEVIGPSAYELVDRQGIRHGSQGETVPWWAPPQTDIRLRWSVIGDCWTPPELFSSSDERQRRREMAQEDFMMKTAYETLTEQEHQRIQDYARREF